MRPLSMFWARESLSHHSLNRYMGRTEGSSRGRQTLRVPVPDARRLVHQDGSMPSAQDGKGAREEKSGRITC